MTSLPAEEQQAFLDAQSAIYPKIGSELIALTPESWKSAVLKLEEDSSGVMHTIYSEEGHREVITPSMELFEHTWKLGQLFRKYGRICPDGHSKCSTYGQSNCSTPVTVN